MSHKFLTESELSAIAAREKAATYGPWQNRYHRKEVTTKDWWAGQPLIAGCDEFEDGDFIAHARQDIPRLLAEVAALREVLGVCHTAISRAREIVGGTDESCCECDTDCFCYCCYYNGIKDRLAAALGKEPTP